jgi:hypothetical protein
MSVAGMGSIEFAILRVDDIKVPAARNQYQLLFSLEYVRKPAFTSWLVFAASAVAFFQRRTLSLRSASFSGRSIPALRLERFYSAFILFLDHQWFAHI